MCCIHIFNQKDFHIRDIIEHKTYPVMYILTVN